MSAVLQPGRARSAAQRAAAYLAGCEGARPPSLFDEGVIDELTGREREVALLAAGGPTSREIADRLVVSIRTVENHLHRTYRKLRISRREELTQLLTRGSEIDSSADGRLRRALPTVGGGVRGLHAAADAGGPRGYGAGSGSLVASARGAAMFERFERDARRAIVRAQDAARRLGAEHIEPEHLLLALAEGHADPAAQALAEAGLDGRAIEAAIEQDLVAALEVVGVPASVVAATPAHPRADRPGFSLPAQRALEQTLQEAVRRGARRLGTEHVLLGLLAPPAVSVSRLLVALDVELERLAALVQVEMAVRR